MERYFDNIGKDLMRVGGLMAKNQTLARLLKYSDRLPYRRTSLL